MKVGLFLTGKSLLVLVKILLDFSAITLIAKQIRQNSSLQEGQSLYLTGLFSDPETVKMLNQNGMLDAVVWQAHKKRRIPA